ncbi:nuclear transport factor 2 family protein [Sphingomonas sp.]|uniref:nuclear transport factor 2 family protein n=1 Tax=Sphingomonas sp. TaxID=28214 RepID=UPI003B3A5349
MASCAPRLALASLVLLSTTAVAGQSAPTPAIAAQAQTATADTAALEAHNRDWLNAYKTRDRAALERILADDFTAVYPDNRVLRKAELIAAATGTSRVIETIDWANLRVLVFGDVAVVTARSTLSGTSAGKPFTASNDYADVYAKRDGRWQAISAHVVRAAPVAPAS